MGLEAGVAVRERASVRQKRPYVNAYAGCRKPAVTFEQFAS